MARKKKSKVRKIRKNKITSMLSFERTNFVLLLAVLVVLLIQVIPLPAEEKVDPEACKIVCGVGGSMAFAYVDNENNCWCYENVTGDLWEENKTIRIKTIRNMGVIIDAEVMEGMSSPSYAIQPIS